MAQALRTHLFEKLKSVVLTSATLCTRVSKAKHHGRAAHAKDEVGNNTSGTGGPPVSSSDGTLHIRQGAYLPHWTRAGAIYSVTYRLADSLPKEVVETWI